LSSEIAGQLEHAGGEARTVRRRARVLAVEALGPVTVIAGLVWAIAQPYRIVFLYPEGKGVYDYLAQPPLLVVLAGLAFGLLVAPGLTADLGNEDERASS
jgi:hypothetical protein